MNNQVIQRQMTQRAAAGTRLVETAVAAVARVPVPLLRARTRGGKAAALARQTAMYLAHVGFGFSLTRVRICFGRDRTTVRHACERIEDRRDDPALEFGLDALQAALQAAMLRLDAGPGRAGR